MATHDSPSRKHGVGPLQFAILRAIRAGWHDSASIRKHLSAKTAVDNLADTLMGMVQRGLIFQGRGRMYYLESRGWAHLPKPGAELIERTGHYVVPPRPPRRPGSDHSHIPSIAAGKRMEYVPHV
jgi:hypothetical protein